VTLLSLRVVVLVVTRMRKSTVVLSVNVMVMYTINYGTVITNRSLINMLVSSVSAADVVFS
jgi:hypothetical protein